MIALWKSNQRQYGYNLSSGGESSHAGCKHSQETRKLLSRMNLGDNNPRRKKERKQVVANKQKSRSVYCEELDKIFSTVQEAADLFGIDASNISKCCKGEAQSSGGFRWMFEEEYNSMMADENSNNFDDLM